MACELAGFAATKLHIDFVIVEKGELQRGELTSVQFGLDIGRHLTDENNFQLTLRAKFSEHTKEKVAMGFQLEAAVTGIIKVSSDTPKEKVQHLAEINGINMLYGTLRGIVLSATGIFPKGPLMLRSFVPSEILNSALGNQPSSEHKEEQPPREENKPGVTSRTRRKRRSPEEEGVKSAQRAVASVVEKADPKAKER
jgi:preprotein translocase subunit SecB